MEVKIHLKPVLTLLAVGVGVVFFGVVMVLSQKKHDVAQTHAATCTTEFVVESPSTPTPTPSPTPKPPTAKKSCNQPCTTDSECASGLTCYKTSAVFGGSSNGSCRLKTNLTSMLCAAPTIRTYQGDQNGGFGSTQH
jgi:hypothetical protein